LVLHAKGYESDPQMYFKVKGPSHTENKVKTLRDVSQETLDQFKSINGFVTGVVTPRRLEQGYEYLLEQQLDRREIKHIGKNKRRLLDIFIKLTSFQGLL
jgi:hypothetical protein